MCKRRILLLTVLFQIQQMHRDKQNLLRSISSYKAAHKNDDIKKNGHCFTNSGRRMFSENKPAPI